ncbi:MAG: hypothetical protein Q4C72_05155 [Eubacteriales bacterium]|nr:hypothetical protein [Eubacteriales bacterium]
MDELNLDRTIRETLHTCAGELQAPDKLKTRVDFVVRSGAPVPKRKMKPWKRTAVALCAVLAVAVTGALASGQVASWSTGRHPVKSWTDFAKTAGYAEKHVPDMKYVESFSNGYAFDKGYEDTIDKRDENNKTLESFTGVLLNYQKDGAELTLDAGPVQSEAVYTSPFDTVRMIGETEVRYRETPQIFLPPDGKEKPTAEEQAKMDAGEINIAYGTAQREENVFYNVKWIEDGISYSIYTTDPAGLTEDDFFQMAAEVIGA